MVAHHFDIVGVTGSNPVPPRYYRYKESFSAMPFIPKLRWSSSFLVELLVFCCFVTSGAYAARVNPSDKVPGIPDVVSGSSDATSQDHNIFSGDFPDNNEIPSYAKATGSQDNPGENDNVPDFEHVRLIPSLTGPQRKQIRAIFDQLKQDIAPMQTDLKSLRQQINDLRDKKQGTNPGNTISGATANQSVVSESGRQRDNVQADGTTAKPWLRALDNHDSQTPLPKNDQPSDIKSLRRKALGLAQQIQAKRQSAWDQVSQQILRPEQVEELNKMRRGEIVGGNNN